MATGGHTARTLPALRLNAASGRLPLPLFFADSRYFPETGGQGQRIGQKWHKSSDPLYPGYSRSLKISQKRAVRCTIPVIIVAKWRAGPATPKYHSAFWQVAGPGGPQPRRNCLIFAGLPDLRISSWQQAGAERAAPSSPAQRPSCNRRAAYLRGGGADTTATISQGLPVVVNEVLNLDVGATGAGGDGGEHLSGEHLALRRSVRSIPLNPFRHGAPTNPLHQSRESRCCRSASRPATGAADIARRYSSTLVWNTPRRH